MTFCESQEDVYSNSDPDMVRILEGMLETDETITARAVARKHPSIKHASSVTRHPARSTLLARFQSQQAQYRTWQTRMPKRSREQLAKQLAQKDSRIAELEHQVEILRVHILAMMRTVGELGGTGKLLRLYSGYREIRRELEDLSVLPKTEVSRFPIRPLAAASEDQGKHEK
jgi:hypothetical protein